MFLRFQRWGLIRRLFWGCYKRLFVFRSAAGHRTAKRGISFSEEPIRVNSCDSWSKKSTNLKTYSIIAYFCIMIYLNEHTDLLDIEKALATVSAQRREQALKFAHESGRRLSLAVYLLLMEGLQKEYGITEAPVFDYLEGGKPVINGHPEIHFNFSHSGKVALCAIDSRPVGADVETARKITPSLIAYTMNEEEQKIIASAPDKIMTFLSFWTKKEAVLKLTGEGIRSDLKKVLDNPELYHIETITTEKYVYSIAKYN